MDNGYEEVYNILYGCKNLNKEQYDLLVSLYGYTVVKNVMEDMAMQDDDFFSEDVTNYMIYINDLSIIPCLNEQDNSILLEQLSVIIKELKDIFLILKCDNKIFSGKRVPLIQDKIDYCLKQCKDHELLSRLESLYIKYDSIRQKIINGNLRLVIKVAKAYKVEGLVSYLDVIQYGNIGLMKAVEKFDITIGTAFSTYATYWINQEIKRNLRNIKYPTWIPEHLLSWYRKISYAMNQLTVKLEREPTNEEISEYIGKPVDWILNIKSLFIKPFSLDDSFEIDEGDYCVEGTLLETVEDKNADIYKIVSERCINEEFVEKLKSILTEKQLFIIMCYFGFGEDYNTSELASMFGVSRQAIEHTKNSALKRLRAKRNVLRSIVN